MLYSKPKDMPEELTLTFQKQNSQFNIPMVLFVTNEICIVNQPKTDIVNCVQLLAAADVVGCKVT